MKCQPFFYVLAFILPSASAFADSAGALFDAADFVTMERLAARSGVSISLESQRVDALVVSPEMPEPHLERANLSQLELRGQLVYDKGWGMFGSLPVHRVTLGDSWSTIGNLELGGQKLAEVGSAAVMHRLSLVLPTAPSGDISAVLAHQADMGTPSQPSARRSMWVRASTSPAVRVGPLISRVDLAVDVPVADEPRLHAILRVGAGLGLELGDHRIGVESNAQMNVRDGGAAAWLTLGGSYRYRGRVSPFVALHRRSNDGATVATAGFAL